MKIKIPPRLNSVLMKIDIYSRLLRKIVRLRKQQPEELSAREVILLASIYKLCDQGKAIRLLACYGFSEEASSLSRIMAEITINAAYLQGGADDASLLCFLNFDQQKNYDHVLVMRNMFGRISSRELLKSEIAEGEARNITKKRDTDPY